MTTEGEMSPEEALVAERILAAEGDAMGGLSQLPTGEPIISQIDEWGREQLIRLCEEFKLITHPETKEQFYRNVEIYPEIRALIVSIGHLEATSNFTWEQANWIYMDWEEYEWEPVNNYYAGDPIATSVLQAIRGVKRRAVFGDSQGGSRQKYLVQMSGNDKLLRLMAGGSGKEKKGFLGLW